MMKALGPLLCLLASAFPAVGQLQTLYIPQVVDGGFWQTTFVFTNTTANAANASMSFRSDVAGGGSQPWSPHLLEVSSTASIVLNPASTTYLHTAGTAVNLTQGYAIITADPGIVVSAIFTIRNPGKQDVEGTSIATAGTTRVLVPFDNTTGQITAVGVVNPTGVAQNIAVNFKTANGTVIQGSLPSVPANGHLAFTLAQQFPGIAGQSGLAEFYTTAGTFSLLALQFTSSGAFTASPVYFQSGAPIISSGIPPANPLVGKTFTMTAITTISGKTLTVLIGGSPNGNQDFLTVSDNPSASSGVNFSLAMNANFGVVGSTATFQNPDLSSISLDSYSDSTNPGNTISGNITAATVTITFSSFNVGSTINGTLNFTVNGPGLTNYNVQATFTGLITSIA